MRPCRSYAGFWFRGVLGVPVRRERRLDIALVLGKRRDRRSILVVELDFQRVEVRTLARLLLRLRDRDDVRLIEEPRYRDLGRRDAVLVSDLLERLLVRGPALGKRRVGGERNALASDVVEHPRLAQERMVLDL